MFFESGLHFGYDGNYFEISMYGIENIHHNMDDYRNVSFTAVKQSTKPVAPKFSAPQLQNCDFRDI